MKEMFSREEILQTVHEVLKEFSDDPETSLEGEVEKFVAGEGDPYLLVDSLCEAAKRLAQRKGYQKEVYFHSVILPIDPDAYISGEDIAVVIVNEEGKCLTFKKHKWGDASIAETFPMESVDDAVAMVDELARIILESQSQS